MDPRRNPYSPGAGTMPPELSGRDAILEQADVALDRIKSGRDARGMVLYGLRGVGKTVLLNRINTEASAKGLTVISMEAREKDSLPKILIPALKSALLKLNHRERLKEKGRKALGVLKSFASACKISFGEFDANLKLENESGSADSGDLDHDLKELLLAAAEAAAEQDTALLISIDELQYIPESELAALITSVHFAAQRQLPLLFNAAGLPQLLPLMGDAKSYSERLLEFKEIDSLSPEAARAALCNPASKEGVSYEDEAVAAILTQTKRYPYFLQVWGKHSWDCADAHRITARDVDTATRIALTEMDQSFFRVRYDRLTPSEKEYARAMAALGPGAHRSGDIAARMKRETKSVAPIRAGLIKKGMIYSPGHGDAAFTVPLFDSFLNRRHSASAD